MLQASAKRDTPIEENLRLFQLLLNGDKQAEDFCLRAKAFYDSLNGAPSETTEGKRVVKLRGGGGHRTAAEKVRAFVSKTRVDDTLLLNPAQLGICRVLVEKRST